MEDGNELNIKREVSWMVARRYTSVFCGRITYHLTVEKRYMLSVQQE